VSAKSPIDVTAFSDDHLQAMIDAARSELKERAIECLLMQPCDCDRYTCSRCSGLQHLGYNYKTYVPRAERAAPVP
jgi:hypothetical protein